MENQTKAMLLDDFFDIQAIQSDNQDLEVKITLNANHKVFNGHFPDNPIVPGVTMIQIFKEILGHKLKRNLFIAKVMNAKFTAILNPEETPVVGVSIKYIAQEGTDSWKVSGSIRAADTIYFRFLGVFRNI